MVVTFLPATNEIGRMQERWAEPLMWTVQAPHWAIPQPYFVPVKFKVSRKTQRSGVSGSMSRVCDLPFSSKLIAMAWTSFRNYRTKNCGLATPLHAGVGNAEALTFGVALGIATRFGDHHGEIATGIDGVAHACVEQGRL